MKLIISLLNIFILAPVFAGNTDDHQPTAPPLGELSGHTIDISSDEKANKAYIERKMLDSIDYEQIKARHDVRVTSFVDGNLKIWENAVKKFTSAAIVYDLGEPLLMFVEESEGGGKKYFMKIFSTWRPITDTEYNGRVKYLRDKVPIESHFALNLKFLHENPKYIIEKYPKKFVNLLIFTPTKNHRAKVVYEGSNILWKATLPTQRCVTIIAYSKGNEPLITHLFIVSDDEPMKYLYMKKVNEQWVEIPEKQYLKDVLTLKFESTDFTPVTLDINEIDSNQFNVKVRTFEEPYFKYVPKSGHRITTVMDGNRVIWKSQDPQMFFAYSVGHINQGGPAIVKVFVNHNSPKFAYNFVKIDDQWEPISDFNLEDRCYALQNDRYRIFDISNPNHQDASIIEMTMDKVRYLLITPRLGRDIMMVRDKGQTVWKYEGMQGYLVNAWLYYFPNEPILFHFRVRNPLMDHDDFYYIKREGYWERATGDEYKHLLNLITMSSKKALSEIDEELSSLVSSKATEYKDLPGTPGTPTSSEGFEFVAPGPGFKQKLYDHYATSSYYPSEDEDITKVISSTEPSSAKVIPHVPYYLLRHTKLDPIKEFEEKSRESYGEESDDERSVDGKSSDTDDEESESEQTKFDHLDPEQVADYIALGARDPTKEPYKSMHELHTQDKEFDPQYRTVVRRSKSSKDLTDHSKRKLRSKQSDEDEDEDEDEEYDDEMKKVLAKWRKGKKHGKKPDSAYIPTTALIVLVSMYVTFM